MRDPGPREHEADESPAITEVDCSPRPRYRETQEQFAARIKSYSSDLASMRKQTSRLNRNDALRWSTATDGAKQYFARCACGWCGLSVSDPELAKREYDDHACAMDAEEIGVRLHRKEPLPAGWADQTKALIEQQQLERSSGNINDKSPYEGKHWSLWPANGRFENGKWVETDEVVDDAEERMKLLELE